MVKKLNISRIEHQFSNEIKIGIRDYGKDGVKVVVLIVDLILLYYQHHYKLDLDLT